MSQVLLSAVAAPSTPAAGKGSVFVDSQKILCFKDDTGRVAAFSFNAAIAAQAGGFAADTYLTNSDLLIPSFGLQAKTNFMWKISASKTGAGVATPVYTIRIGSGRTTSDTARVTLTGPAQTAVADIGTLYIMATVRVLSATVGVIAATAWWEHRGTVANTTTSGTGFASDTTGHVEATSSNFDNTGLGGNYVGLSINGGTSAVWSPTQVIAEASW